MSPLVMVNVMAAFMVAVTAAAPASNFSADFFFVSTSTSTTPAYNFSTDPFSDIATAATASNFSANRVYDIASAAPAHNFYSGLLFDIASAASASNITTAAPASATNDASVPAIATDAASLPHRADYFYISAAKKFYKQHHYPASWDRARGICHQEGAELAYPGTAQQQEALRIMQRGLTGGGLPADMWLGIYDSHSWRNVYNETINIGKLNYEPRTGVYLAANGLQSATDFSAELPFVCEASTAAVCDPSVPGYALGPDGRSCYKFHQIRNKNWTQALLTCVAENAQLAVINSQQEADHLGALLVTMKTDPTDLEVDSHPHASSGIMGEFAAFLATVRPNYMFIGAAKRFPGLGFFTVDGHPLASSGYEKWAPGEPNNRDENDSCVSMYRNGLMNDISCSRKAPFICEKKASVPVLDMSA